ncbi:MAG: hypothetical protein Q4G07_08725 [Oscillospiraceae bacterium]|nr:hypothetical protein [Oscillospiraceae bacterium]
MNEENQNPELNASGAADLPKEPVQDVQPSPAGTVAVDIQPQPAPVQPSPAAEGLIPAPEGYIPAPTPKKHSLLWLWITLPVLVVVLVVLLVLLLLKPGGPSFSSSPDAYLSRAIVNTGSALAESFSDSPFAAMAASCQELKDLNVKLDFLADFEELGGDSLRFSLEEGVNFTQRTILGSLSIEGAGQKIDMAAYGDENDVLVQLANTGWKGFSLDSFQEDFENSIFFPGSGSAFEFSHAEAADLIESTSLIRSLWASLDEQPVAEPAEPAAPVDAEKFFHTLTSALPQPDIGKTAYTFADQEKNYDSYTYHLASEDLARLADAFWDAVEAEPRVNAFFDNMFEGSDEDPRDSAAYVAPDVAFTLTVAFYQDRMIALSFFDDEGRIDLLLGEDPARSEEMSFTFELDGQKLGSITRRLQRPSGSEGFSDVFAITMYDDHNDAETIQEVSIGTKWNKQDNAFSLLMGVTAENTPVQFSLDGTLKTDGKGKGFALNIDELSMKLFTMKQALPIHMGLTVEPGQKIVKPEGAVPLFSMTEEEAYAWMQSLSEVWMLSYTTAPEYDV